MFLPDQVLMTGPFVLPGDGLSARRIILQARLEDNQFAEFYVHTQYARDDGSSSVEHGDYLLVRDRDPHDVFRRALAKFNERVARDTAHYPLAVLEADPVRFQKFLPAERHGVPTARVRIAREAASQGEIIASETGGDVDIV